MRKFVLFAALFLLPQISIAQTSNPGQQLLERYQNQAALAGTFEYKAGEFKLASYSTRDLGSDFTRWIQVPVQKMKRDSSLHAIIYAYHDSTEWLQRVQDTLDYHLQEGGNENDYLNAQVAQNRARAVVREMTARGIAGERIRVHPVLAPHKRRTVKISLVPKRDYVGVLRAVAKLAENQQALQDSVRKNAQVNRSQQAQIEDLQKRLSKLEGEECCEQPTTFTRPQTGILLGLGLVFSSYPDQVSRHATYLTGEVGYQWRNVFVRAYGGVSPFSSTISLNDGQAKTRAWLVGASSGYLHRVNPFMSIGPGVGVQLARNRLLEKEGYNSQRISANFGLRTHLRLNSNFFLQLSASWTPEVSSTNYNEDQWVSGQVATGLVWIL